MFFKIGVLENIEHFTGKNLCWRPFFIKLQACRPTTLLKRVSNTAFFLCEIFEIFKNTFFYKTSPVDASRKREDLELSL